MDKFSVIVKDEVQFAHLFKSNANCTTYVKCCSGVCQTQFNKKVRAIFISNAAPINIPYQHNQINLMTKVMENWIKNQLLFILMMKQIIISKFLTGKPSKYGKFVFVVLSKMLSTSIYYYYHYYYYQQVLLLRYLYWYCFHYSHYYYHLYFYH